MPGRLPIVDVAVSGLSWALRSLPGLLGIYWLPWLLGTIVLLILEVVVQDQLRLGWAPGWARSIMWAPFAAMAYLMLLRWVLNGAAPERPINLDAGRQTWIAAPVVAAWGAADAMDAFIPMLAWLALTGDPSLVRVEHIEAYAFVLQLAAWLTDSALLAGLFGLIVVVARGSSLDLREHWRLLRLQPVRLFCVCLLATAAVGGLRNVGQQALAWLGAGQLAPGTLIPWRAHIRQAFLAELALFPLHFLEFVLQGSILAEAYRRLLRQPAAQPQAAQA